MVTNGSCWGEREMEKVAQVEEVEASKWKGDRLKRKNPKEKREREERRKNNQISSQSKAKQADDERRR